MSGLDVSASLVFRDLLHKLAAQGKTILFSSHILEVVERVCSHVVILNKGSVAADDSICRLRELMSLPSLEAIFEELTEQRDPGIAADRIIEAMRA